jgi:hypothetical protein
MQLTCFRTWAAGLGFVLRCRAEVLVEPLGGWRIVHTMGSKITKLTPMQGFCAETGGRDHAFSRDRPRHPRFDDAYDHRRDRRRWRRPQGIRSALEHRQEHCRRLGHHHADGGDYRRDLLRAGEVGRLKFRKSRKR